MSEGRYSYLDLWELKYEMEEMAAELKARWGGGKPTPDCFDLENAISEAFFRATDSTRYKHCDHDGCDKWVGVYTPYCKECRKEREEEQL